MDNRYSDLFSQHEPDLLLRELNGNVLWYWKPMSPNDKRMGCLSNAPFEAADRIKKLEAALRRIAHAPHGKVYCADGHEEAVLIARAAIEGEASHD